MATTTRPSRFPYAPPMPPSRDEKSPQATSSFAGANLQNIWTAAITPKREVGSGGSDNTITTSTGPALAASVEEPAWSHKVWNSPDTASHGVGGTSPNRKRDNLGYFDNPNANFGTGTFRNNFNRPKDYREDGGQPSDHRGFGAVGRENRSPSNSQPPSRADDTASMFPDYHFSGNHTPNNSVQFSRPSLNPTLSLPPQVGRASQSYDPSPRQQDEGNLGVSFKSLSLSESHSSATFPNPGSQPFHPTSASQPWPDGPLSHPRYSLEMASSGYMAPFETQFAQGKRGPSGSERVSPTMPYDLVTSPKRFTPPLDSWNARPPSRDTRGSETGRRTPGHTLPHQAPPFFPPPYYHPNFVSQYAASMFDPYGHGSFRAPLHLSGYGIPMHPYLQGPGAGSFRGGREQDPSKGMRSMLLEEFRGSSKSNKRFELKDIYGHVVEFSGDQHGSRFIQQKLETANSDEKEVIFQEIEPNAVQLMKDVFGNYVIQKFFEHGNQVQKKMLASQMNGKVVDLSTQMYACRVVQKALEHVLVEQQAELVKELEPDIIKIVRDQNGNHVVQKIIELVPRQHIGFIMDSFRGQVAALASHTYGCRVVQRMLEHGSEKDKEDIMAELHASAQILITDQFGNYVTQHVIQHGQPEDRSRMVRLVTSQLLTLSKHKFASNVVEKCIEYGTPEERKAIQRHLSASSNDGTGPLQHMMKDQYGNYVIQKLLTQLEGAERASFIEDMRPQFMALKKSSNLKHVQALEKLMGMSSTSATHKAGSASASSTSVTPALQVDVNSAAPTPVLTMEPNSPQSSSPPSTNASAVGDSIDDAGTAKQSIAGSLTPPEVLVQEL